ncbi:AsnC family transcriptional regulator [Halonatronum saccharophilum]|uniref:siroheme decarboxylase subunit alpha n=1 Tax=Halonatronum saccharophilum TaxID=150060 RepID=UPI00048332CC|nr:AsnC family transcriptional regulator [Halonatronum saccharophilum]
MDEVDRRLLTLAQEGIPISSTPYKDLGREIGISGGEVVERLNTLKEEGYIRRLGGIFSSKRLGYVSTLVATRVEEESFYEVADVINRYDGVTHNYRRNHDFNLWFTLIAPSKDDLEDKLEEIESIEGIEKMRNLPAQNLFKLGVKLKV